MLIEKIEMTHWNISGYLFYQKFAKLISKEMNQYAKQFLENKSDLKLRFGVHHWNDK
jgi:hypothetical protein